MIRIKLDAGTLAEDAPAKLWAGQGNGKTCSACDQTIGPSQAEYETEYDDGRPPIRFHAACHALWDEERQKHREAR
jgi:hypothetical protein